MRDAFGGTFMLKIIIIFIVIYVLFIGLGINYAKAYRVKNQVINFIEQYQYSGDNATETKISDYLEKVPYRYNSTKIAQHCRNNAGKLIHNDICVVRTDATNSSVYYKVFSYIIFQPPFFGTDFVIPVSGETKVIEY